MKAIQVHQYGHADQMKLEDIQQPKLEKGMVLVKIRDAGVNPIDWKIREGYMKSARTEKFPYTMGQDFSGEVIEVGDNVSGFRKGDHVYGFAQGTYAEYALASPKELAHIPNTIDDAAAASIPTAGLTAWQIVMDVLKLSKNQTVLIHGAGGGVGSFALQFAKKAGAKVIATASIEDFSYLQQLGAEKCIDYKSERFEQVVDNLDAVIDLIGGETLNKSYQVVRKNGLIVTTVGPANETEAKKHGARVVQFMMQRNGEELEQLGRLIEDGSLKPRISKIMSLTNAQQAEDLSQTGHPHGKVVLRVA